MAAGDRSSEDAVPVLRGGETSAAISRLITKGELACLSIALFACVQLLRFGTRYDHLWLLGGAIVSGAALFGYPLLVWAKGKRGVLLSLVPIAGLLPYALGSYLVFFRGFWGLREGLSVFTLVRTLLYVLVGYQLVSSTYRATEFVRAVDEDRLRIE